MCSGGEGLEAVGTWILLFPLLLVCIGGVINYYLERLKMAWILRLDGIERLTLNLVMGCLTVYLLALIFTPFHLYTKETAQALAVIFPLAYIFLERRRIAKFALKVLRFEEHLDEMKAYLAILLIFFGAYAYRLAPLNFIVFGSVHDESLHSLFIRLMEINKGIPETHQPYLPQYLVFPQGLHVVFTLAYYLYGGLIPVIVLYAGALFNALSIFGGYFFGREVYDTRLGLAMAFVMAFVAQYPICITWGGIMMPVGIMLYLIVVGIFYRNLIYGRGGFKRKSVIDLIPLGLILGYLGSVHLILYILALTTMALIFVFKMVKALFGRETKKTLLTVISEEIFIFLISLIPMAIWIYRYLFAPRIFIEKFEYEEAVKELVYKKSEKFGRLFPAQVIFNPLKHVMIYIIWFNWYVKAAWPGSDLFLTLLSLTPLLLLHAYYRNRRLFKHMVLSSLPYLSVLVWAMDTPHGLYYLSMEPFSIMTGEADKLMIWLTVALSIYAAYSLSALYTYLGVVVRWLDRKLLQVYQVISSEGGAALPEWGATCRFLAKLLPLRLGLAVYKRLRRGNRYLPALIIIASVLVSAESGVYFLLGNYKAFAVATWQDRKLMVWMRDNLPQDAVILINQYEPGTFIPSISHHRVIFPWTGDPSSQPPTYLRLTNMTGEGILNETAYELLDYYNITHVYVGSRTSYFWVRPKWDVLIFLGNPNFRLVAKRPDAYLFAYTPTNTSVSFFEDFEHANISETGWIYFSCWECRGKGLGCADIASFAPYTGDRHLVSVAVNIKGEYYAYYPYRKIYTPPLHRVVLTLYLNASQGFGPRDCAAIVVADEWWEKQVAFLTPCELRGLNITSPLPNFTMNPCIFKLDRNSGVLTLDISEAWWEAFREDVPHPFYIALVNYDEDGRPNIMVVDTITVSCRPLEPERLHELLRRMEREEK